MKWQITKIKTKYEQFLNKNNIISLVFNLLILIGLFLLTIEYVCKSCYILKSIKSEK
jgi:uncharacterized membrane protein (DUF373 family)